MADYVDLNYCPRCAHPLEDRQVYGRVRRYCPMCDRPIFRDPKVAAGLVIEREGQVLLVRRGTGPGMGMWSIPAGFVEYDEDPALTAIRECREETGLAVEIDGLLDVVPGGGLPGEASFLIVYRGRLKGGDLKAGDDAQEAAFFSPDRLPPLAFASTRRALSHWQETR